MSKIINLIRKVGASCFFVGYSPFASGTVASFLVIVILFLGRDHFSFILGPENALSFWWVAVTLTAISFFLCDKGKEIFGRDDPKETVFDEVVGQFITFFMVPINIRTLILGFALFRFFDIIKPFPVYRLEELDGGLGVTMDDVAAGIMANITLIFTMYVYGWVMAYL